MTDKEFNIITLLRIVPERPDQEELRVGLAYSLDSRQNYCGVPELTPQRVKDAIRKALDKETAGTAPHSKRSKRKHTDAIRRAISTSLNEFPPILIDHAMQLNGFITSTPLKQVLEDKLTLEEVVEVLAQAQNIIRDITIPKVSKGYIIAKSLKGHPRVGEAGEPSRRENLVYEDFHPFRPQQFEEDPEMTIIEIEGFNRTVDEFFSSLESQKLESRLVSGSRSSPIRL